MVEKKSYEVGNQATSINLKESEICMSNRNSEI